MDVKNQHVFILQMKLTQMQQASSQQQDQMQQQLQQASLFILVW